MEESIHELKEKLEQIKSQNNNLIKENQQRNDELNKLKASLYEEQKLKNNLIKENKKLDEELKKLKLMLEEEQNIKKDILQININLNKKIKELEIKITDLNAKLKRYPYDLEENEKLISVIFSSVDQRTHYSLICKNTHSINNLEPELYKEYPDYSNSYYYFLCKGNWINKFETLENNHIKNGDVIILNKKE